MSNTQRNEIVAPDLHFVVNKFKELPENDRWELIAEASGELEDGLTVDKHPEESEEDFMVRILKELFDKLPLDSLWRLWSKIKDKLIRHQEPISTAVPEASEIVYIQESGAPIIPRDVGDEFPSHTHIFMFKVKNPDLRHGGFAEEEGKNKSLEAMSKN